jgi:hypothetical protein
MNQIQQWQQKIEVSPFFRKMRKEGMRLGKRSPKRGKLQISPTRPSYQSDSTIATENRRFAILPKDAERRN